MTYRARMGFREKQEERRERRAEEAEAQSPAGRARAAHERGDALFHLAIPTKESGEALNAVTAEGWTLTNMAVAWQFGQQVEYLKGISAVGGTMMGYYVFTRT